MTGQQEQYRSDNGGLPPSGALNALSVKIRVMPQYVETVYGRRFPKTRGAMITVI